MEEYGIKWTFTGEDAIKKTLDAADAAARLDTSLTAAGSAAESAKRVENSISELGGASTQAAKELNKLNTIVTDYRPLAISEVAASLQAVGDTSPELNAAAMAAEAVGSAIGRMVSWAGGLYGVQRAFRYVIDSTNTLAYAADRVGGSIEDIGAWSQALDSAGQSGADFLGTLDSLTTALEDSIIMGGPMQQYFAQLGIAATDVNGELRDTTDILQDLATVLSKYDTRQQYRIGRQLGIDDGTSRFLTKYGDGVGEAIDKQRELAAVTDEAGERTVAANKAFKDFYNALRAGVRILVVSVLPAVTWVVQGLADFATYIVSNRPLFYAFFTTLAYLIGTALVRALVSLGAAWGVGFWPLVGILAILGAISGALALLIDDFMVWQDGGESFFGDLYDGVNSVIEKVKELGAELKAFWDDPIGYLSGRVEEATADRIAAIDAPIVPERLEDVLLDVVPNLVNPGGTINMGVVAANADRIDATIYDPAGVQGAELPNKSVNDEQPDIDWVDNALNWLFGTRDESAAQKASAQGILEMIQGSQSANVLFNQSAGTGLGAVAGSQLTSAPAGQEVNVNIAELNVDARGGDSEEISQGIYDSVVNVFSNDEVPIAWFSEGAIRV